MKLAEFKKLFKDMEQGKNKRVLSKKYDIPRDTLYTWEKQGLEATKEKLFQVCPCCNEEFFTRTHRTYCTETCRNIHYEKIGRKSNTKRASKKEKQSLAIKQFNEKIKNYFTNY